MRGCLTIRRYDLWLSIITLFLILVFEASRAPFELFNIHHVLTNWNMGIFPIQVQNSNMSLSLSVTSSIHILYI